MILNILLNYKASHFRATTIVITKTWIIYFLYNLMQDFGFSWPVRKPHSIPADISLSLHKLLTEVWAAGQSLVTRQDQDVVCDRAVDENPGVGWHWWTWSSVKCGHNQTLLRCDPSSPFSDPEKTLLPQWAAACRRCLPLPSLEGQKPLFTYDQGVQSVPHVCCAFPRCFCRLTKMFFIKIW